MHYLYDVIEIDNYVTLNAFENFHFVEYFISVYPVGLKHVEPYICKMFKTNIILIIMYFIFNWNIVETTSFIL